MGKEMMNGYGVILIITVAVLMIISIGGIWFYRKKMEDIYDGLLQKLDHAIAGDMQTYEYDESMDSAVTERLNRVVRIASLQRDEAEEERDVVKALISDISHQIRTPLSNIILYTDLLKEQSKEPDTVDLADKIQKNSAKLDFFMKELVKTSYAEQEMIAVYPEMVSAEEIVDKACQNVEVAALKKRIRFEKNLRDVICYADKKWSIEAVGNVMDNAIKYSAPDSMVWINIAAYEAFVCVKITDYGIGIPESEQGKVFDRFYRGGQVKQEAGSGIGLYLTREVLAKQGGYVKIKSQPDKGTTVELYVSRYPV